MKRSLSEIIGSIIVISIVIASIAIIYNFYYKSINDSSKLLNMYQKKIIETYDPPLISMIYNSSGLYSLIEVNYPINISYLIIKYGNRSIIDNINKFVTSHYEVQLIKNYNCSQNVSLLLVTSDGAIIPYNPYYDPNINKNLLNPSFGYFSCMFLYKNNSSNSFSNHQEDTKLLYNETYFNAINPPDINYYTIKTNKEININVSGNLNNNLNLIFYINGETIELNNNGISLLSTIYVNDSKIYLYGGGYYNSPYTLVYLYFYSNNTSFYILSSNIKGTITFTASVMAMPIILHNAPILTFIGDEDNYFGTLNYTNTLINGANNIATYVGNGKINGSAIISGPLIFYFSNIGITQNFNINLSLILKEIINYNYSEFKYTLPYYNYLKYNIILSNETYRPIIDLYKAISMINIRYPYLMFVTPLGNVDRNLYTNYQIFQAPYNISYLIYFPYILLYYNSLPSFYINKETQLTYYLILNPVNTTPSIINPVLFTNINNITYFISNDNFSPKIKHNNVNLNQSIIYEFINGLDYNTSCNQNIFYSLINNNGEFELQNEFVYGKNFLANLNNGLYVYVCFNNLTNDSINLAYFS
ncbi:hypothetical protein Calag_0341 [Caldisphaera lagunensis DSM 15908]|uniref:Uncharacterized protein n=1 Tax=Caldisphaera lagunensis (strain DSM 15908 / JCM 11604 / ANMR 0165 / IC-154) TaxID=1056495 RepID=L0A8E2_CALLD|nr:hypothetical protein [Caldisphaera lagunensis]AFZ70118.1 hypothetical protein Calag_0341 [Caldisphaera lagunensis DSM 15908]